MSMTPQAMLKARFAELAERHGVRITARRQGDKYYFEVFGDYPATQKFMRAAIPDAELTSGGGFSVTYRLPPPDVERILGELETNPDWLNAATRRLAEGIRKDQAFERLPILADALEEAGCDNAALLRHCRESAPHGETCWVLELLLGPERKSVKRKRDS